MNVEHHRSSPLTDTLTPDVHSPAVVLPWERRRNRVRETITDDAFSTLRGFVSWLIETVPTRGDAARWLVDALSIKPATAEDNIAYLIKAGLLHDADGRLAPTPPVATWVGDLDDLLTPIRLMHARIRFVGELLEALRDGPKSVADLRRIATTTFRFDWKGDRQVASRLGWLKAARLVADADDNSQHLTSAGTSLLAELPLHPGADAPELRYWLMSLGRGSRFWDACHAAGIACIGWDDLGDLSQYADRTAMSLGKNDSLACWQFSREMSPGDIVFVKSGNNRICGHGTVVSGYRFDDAREKYKNVRDVDWHSTFPDGVELDERLLPLKTLTDITRYPVTVQDLTNAVGLHVPPPAVVSRRPTAYTAESIREDGCFLPRSTIEKLLARLESKKNLILQGPPGTGKTWLAKRLAYALIGRRDRNGITAIQFHPTLSYEDFVLGWRPGVDGRLKLNDGVFLRAIETAKRRSTPHVVVIEEINRGNPAQIFGELITLLEADKRSEDEAVELAYTDGSEPRIAWLPPNLYVIGTMNIADRSLALVDLALRRRFAFATLEPALGPAWRAWVTDKMGIDPATAADIERRLNALNDAIAADSTLGPQFRIGHSYVTPSEPLEPGRAGAWFRDVVETEIGPLLEEYWFDHPNSAQRELKKLRPDA